MIVARVKATLGAQRGFTLTELAVVVGILALLVGGLLVTLAAQTSVREFRDTQRTLELAREALLGFAASNGRLPCPAPAPPAPATAPGPFAVEAFVDAATPAPARNLSCAAVGGEGFLPAITLGIGPTDRFGYLLDAWGNPVRYAVSPVITNALGLDITRCPPNAPWPAPPAVPGVLPDYSRCPAFTTSNAILSLGFAALPTTAPGLFRVCTEVACTGPVILTPAVIWSPGKNFATAGGVFAADEAANATVPGDGTFVYHTPTPVGSPAGEFDDVVITIPPAVLYNRLLAAGGV